MAITTLRIITTGTYNLPTDIDASTVITVIAIGGGAGGKTNGTGGGGGGGAFALTTISGLAAGSQVYTNIGSGGAAAVNGGDTWFNKAASSAPTVNTNGVLAKGGSAGISNAGGIGGLSASSIGTTVSAGGNGGAITSTGASQGGAGGGSAGSSLGSGFAGGATTNVVRGGGGGGGGVRSAGTAATTGAGATGGNGFPNNTGGTTGVAGVTGAGGGGSSGTTTTAAPGGAGGPGAEYTVTSGGTTVGAGGGGGGGGGSSSLSGSGDSGANGGAGGAYGGGGGSAGKITVGGGNTAGIGGAGGAGLLILQYTPVTTDTVPDAFTFIDQTNVAISTVVTSAAITVAGLSTGTTTTISVSGTGGSYSLDGTTFTTTPGTVSNGSTVYARHTSSATQGTTTDTTINIGGVTDIFTSTTIDTTPNVFTFTDQTGVALNTVIISAAITVSGITSASPISITGGTYSINSGTYTNSNGTVNNGDSVTVSHTSSPSNSATTDTTLNIGGVTDIFTSTTVAAGATYNVVPASSSVNEGSSLVFNVTTSGVSNTTLYWTISPASDVSATSGSFALTSNAGSFTLTATADSLTEGLETFTVSVRTTSITGTVVATTVFSINDTSTGVAGNNRVVLGKLGDGVTYGLEVSKPGYDVLTAGREDIIFSSKWGGAGNILMQGFSTVTYTNTGGGTQGQGTFTITYPTTYDYFPMVFACITDSTNSTVYGFNTYGIFTRIGAGPAGGTDVLAPKVSVVSGLSSAAVSVLNLTSGVPWGVRYYVLAISGGS